MRTFVASVGIGTLTQLLFFRLHKRFNFKAMDMCSHGCFVCMNVRTVVTVSVYTVCPFYRFLHTVCVLVDDTEVLFLVLKFLSS
jgi:hypothetical protein